MGRSVQDQQSEIFSWLDDGEEGLQRIIGVLKSPDTLVRRIAYEVLQMMHEEIAQNV
jgi:HEAT repeat protein